MKKIIYLLLGQLMITSASATEYQYFPLVREGVVWEYVGYNSVIGLNRDSEETKLYTLEFKGNTTVEGKEYSNLYRTDYDKQGNPSEPYLVALVKEEEKIVTAIGMNYWWQVPDTVYDFNKPMFLPNMAQINQNVETCYPYPYDIDNSTLMDFEIAGNLRKGYHINYGGEKDSGELQIGDFNTIEGIGVDCIFGDLLISFRNFATGAPMREVDYGNPMAGLSAVYENDNRVYKGCLYDFAKHLKDPSAITAIDSNRYVSSVRFYNLAGVESTEPVKGVNIKVTIYSDGSRSIAKELK